MGLHTVIRWQSGRRNARVWPSLNLPAHGEAEIVGVAMMVMKRLLTTKRCGNEGSSERAT